MRIYLLGILSFVAWIYILSRQYLYIETVLINQDYFIIALIELETFMYLPFLMMFPVIPLTSAIISEYTIRYFKNRDNPHLFGLLAVLYALATIHMVWLVWTFFTTPTY
ncbi:hypothetical protein [Exiguobacterium sp. AM39-5BH]|uniref:hypothetical protein n=1 Tax=Exiguobacterium sp. AM39-5BH TaxID=2292355 RepID=UPI000FE22531|nr:hypothetical protein [Exiguobacterium sp. AM39-5BH]RHB46773.1 hypothetical protein DW881_13730 [Exiguobacterium sp. AM39-5BH]